MKAAVIQFPGSNCDFDMYYALQGFGADVQFVTEKSTDLSAYDAVFLPGGFSYGDYLRTGAVARFAPVMTAVQKMAATGKLVVGVCNGFQILTEAGMLPGQLMMNQTPGFICDEVKLTITNRQTAFTNQYIDATTTIKLPIAHGEGRYVADDATVRMLHENGQVVLTYATDVNGSVDQIAGITNRSGNVIGLMPHPERAVETLLGNTDGRPFFESLLSTIITKETVEA